MFMPLTHSGLEIQNGALRGGAECFLSGLLASKARLTLKTAFASMNQRKHVTPNASRREKNVLTNVF